MIFIDDKDEKSSSTYNYYLPSTFVIIKLILYELLAYIQVITCTYTVHGY